MPDEPRAEAEAEAEMAKTFYDHLLHRGMEERVAAELTTAYILGRQRRDKRESWERD